MAEAKGDLMDRQIDHLITTVRIAQDLLPRNTVEGKDINHRLNIAIDEVIRARSRQDYIKSNAERGIRTIPMQG